jgi:hypothetical protein
LLSFPQRERFFTRCSLKIRSKPHARNAGRYVLSDLPILLANEFLGALIVGGHLALDSVAVH